MSGDVVIFLVFLITSSCFSSVVRKSCIQSVENSTHAFVGPYGAGEFRKVLQLFKLTTKTKMQSIGHAQVKQTRLDGRFS